MTPDLRGADDHSLALTKALRQCPVAQSQKGCREGIGANVVVTMASPPVSTTCDPQEGGPWHATGDR